MTHPEYSRGRKRNAATASGKPEADAPEKTVMRVGREARKRAGPDGPDATVIGDTFKAQPDGEDKQAVAGDAPRG